MSRKFRSTLEAHLNGQLKRSGIKYGYESERLPYSILGYYLPDFVLDVGDGKRIYIEAKGYFRPEAKRKMKAVKEQHPDKDIRLIFSRKDKGNERWADKYGFPYAISTIPEEWFT